VERWFRDLTDTPTKPSGAACPQCRRRVNNEDPKPFVWTATAEQILAKVARRRLAFKQVKIQK
jgi:hypothetical protein